MASIRRLPSGKWQAQFRPIPGGKQVTKTSDRKATVQRWLDEQTAALVTGTYADPRAGRESLRTFYGVWAARQIWQPGTVRAMELAILSAPFVDQPLRSITRVHVEQWVKAMQTKPRDDGSRGLAPQTIRTRVMNVRSVMRAAVAERKIGSDPTLGVRLPALRKAEHAMQIPSSEQVRGWLDAISPEYAALIALCAFGGLRLGEAAALQVGDVDFLKRTVHVARQVQRVQRSGIEIKPPKYGSERSVAAADGLLAILGRHVALRGLQGLAAAWLFPGENGKPAHQNTIAHHWYRAQRSSGHTGYHLHSLRHFYASGLIAAGCDISTVQHALGHSSPTVTLGIYTHLWPKAEDRTRSAAQALVAAVLAPADESVTNARTAPA